MSRDARKKEKQRLKREQKRKQARRAGTLTPLDRVARSGGELECYVNSNWRDGGMASLHVVGIAPGGRLAYAGFLVDIWCVGLKDAFGLREITRPHFEEMLAIARRGHGVVRLPAAGTRRLVAGGIRFARQNGFKLPPHYDRWTAILGDLGDVASADLDGFGVDGGLRYIGTKAFLQRRLAACSVDEFLRRPDVQWLMGDLTPRDIRESDLSDDLTGDEDEVEVSESDEQLLEEIAQSLSRVGDQAEDAVRKWCFQTRQPPHPRLREALNTLLVSVMPMAAYASALEEDPEAAEEIEVPTFEEFTSMNLDSIPPADRAALEEAMDQVSEFIRQFDSPTAMLEVLTGHSLPPRPAQ